MLRYSARRVNASTDHEKTLTVITQNKYISLLGNLGASERD
jgi:hypothetical protein